MSKNAKRQNHFSIAEWIGKLINNEHNAETTDADLENIVAESKRANDHKKQNSLGSCNFGWFFTFGSLFWI